MVELNLGEAKQRYPQFTYRELWEAVQAYLLHLPPLDQLLPHIPVEIRLNNFLLIELEIRDD